MKNGNGLCECYLVSPIFGIRMKITAYPMGTWSIQKFESIYMYLFTDTFHHHLIHVISSGLSKQKSHAVAGWEAFLEQERFCLIHYRLCSYRWWNLFSLLFSANLSHRWVTSGWLCRKILVNSGRICIIHCWNMIYWEQIREALDGNWNFIDWSFYPLKSDGIRGEF